MLTKQPRIRGKLGNSAARNFGPQFSSSHVHHNHVQSVIAKAGKDERVEKRISSTTAMTTYGSYIMAKVQNIGLEAQILGLQSQDAQKKLTAKITSARHWRAVTSILHGSVHMLDPRGLTCALHSLARLTRARKLSDADRTQLDSSVTQVMARVTELISQFDSRGIVTITVSLAKLDMQSTADYEMLMATAHKHMSSFSPQALSNLIWALATVECCPTSEWLDGFYAAVERQVAEFNCQDISNCLWGLCRFERMPPLTLMAELERRALEELAGMTTGQDASTIITCLARYRYQRFGYRVSEEWLRSFEAIITPELPHYMPQDLVGIIHSMVTLNHMPREDFMRTFYQVLKDRLTLDPTLSYSDFPRLLWALTRLDFAPSPLWAREFCNLTTSTLPHLKSKATAELVWALAVWECRPTRDWLTQFFSVTTPKLQDFPLNQLSLAAVSLSTLQCRAPTSWLQAALQRACSCNLQEVQAHDLVNCLDALTRLCDDKQWLSQQLPTLKLLADVAAVKFTSFDPILHTKLLVALSRANYCPGATWLSEQQASLSRCWHGDIDNVTRTSIKQVYDGWEVEIEQKLAAELDVSNAL